MAKLIKSLRGMRLPLKNKWSLLAGTLAVLILFLSCEDGDASPSTARHNNSISLNRRSASSSLSQQLQDSSSSSSSDQEGEANNGNDFNSTFLGGDGKMCSATGPGCPKLGLDMKSISLELIRQDILKKLRIDENKMPTKGNFTYDPSYLSRFVDFQGDSPPRDEYYDDEHATTEKIIAFSKPEQATIGGKQAKNLYQFSFSDKMSTIYIESATMYIHVHHHGQHSGDRKNSNINIRIREPLKTMKGDSPHWVTYGTFKPTILRQDGSAAGTSDYHPKRHSKWIQIDIRDSLSKWVVSSRKITLAIEAVDNAGNPSQEVTVVSSMDTKTNNQNPFVEVGVSDAGRSRHTRNIAMTCDENSDEKRCCKYPLTVDFEEFGWDWIIAPKKYDANYCSGECPYAFLQAFPHNHIVQQANPSGIGGPCCAARKHSAISMLYFDTESNIVFSILPGMVVEKCGCS